jgi:hypothetical protein
MNKEETMRVTLLSVILMIIGAVMMGCTNSITPCQLGTQDEDCAIGFDGPWGDNDAADFGDFGMECNMDVTPFEECQQMASYLDFLPDFLPIDIGMDCSEFEGMDDYGVCGSSWGPF